MREDENGNPARRPDFVVGQDLSLMSVGDLDEAVALLESEIRRLAAERDKRDHTRLAAEALFGKPA